MTIIAVGISHKQAPISVREILAVPADKLPCRLQELRALSSVREALILSTCNRLEIFAVADSWNVAGDIVDTLDAAAAPLRRPPSIRGSLPRERGGRRSADPRSAQGSCCQGRASQDAGPGAAARHRPRNHQRPPG